MKKNVIIIFLMLWGITAYTQTTDTISIATSAQCEMCKERIEKVMAYESGVTSSELDLSDKILRVVYKPNRTNPDKIRKAVTDTGYDADDKKADAKAYSKLPGCCKKPGDKEHRGM